MWKALEALERAFSPIGAEPRYRHSFKFTIVQQTCHQITVAGNSECEARTLALAEARRASRWPRWLPPLEVLTHERLIERFHVTRVQRLPPPSPDDDLLWPPIMP